MQWLKNNLANFFTLGNLASGFVGMIMVFNRELPDYAFWFLILGVVFDFLDGLVARATKTTSKLGADLDSLADMVTFGILPGSMIFTMIPKPYSWIAIAIPLLSAWRLAKFNNDTRSNNYFYGLPSPANALYIAGIYSGLLPLMEGLNLSSSHNNGTIAFLFFSIAFVFSLTMLSDIRLLSNKMTNFSASKYKWHLVVLTLGITLILFFGYLGVSFAIISYVLISIIATFASSETAK